MFAGIVLVTANLFGIGAIVAGQSDGRFTANAAVAPDTLPAKDTPDAGPVTAKTDSGPAAPPALPRAAQPACYGAGCPTVPSRPESNGPGGTGRHYQPQPQPQPGGSVNYRGLAAPYESGSGSSNRPRNAITDV
ncbi:hypothetical protein [Streptomyces monomycini]|uniref:hypothetical protein n=1 Tax=Streptomyces monomycini TaxID=371720 RepID=UPI0004AA3B84|nr:hypothetical protein [Streptomyces monomycini]